MKIISLNCWGGRKTAPLLEFVKKYNTEADVFCFQEVYGYAGSPIGFSNGANMNLVQDLETILSDYIPYFAPKSIGYDYAGTVDFPVQFGLISFVKKGLTVHSHEELFEYISHPNHDWKKTAPEKAQILELHHAGKKLWLCNFHGVWVNGSGKRDIPERIRQSETIKNMLYNREGEKILYGDFNLLPNTESMQLLEEGMVNLITKFGIASTRSVVYDKPDKFADYALVSPGVTVKNFHVLPDEVSDHLPLLLEIE